MPKAISAGPATRAAWDSTTAAMVSQNRRRTGRISEPSRARERRRTVLLSLLDRCALSSFAVPKVALLIGKSPRR